MESIFFVEFSATFKCPSGYDAVSEDLNGTGKKWARPHQDSSRTINDCASICDERQGCTGFEFAEGGSTTGACGTYTGGNGNMLNDDGRLNSHSDWRSCINSSQGDYNNILLNDAFYLYYVLDASFC